MPRTVRYIDGAVSPRILRHSSGIWSQRAEGINAEILRKPSLEAAAAVPNQESHGHSETVWCYN